MTLREKLAECRQQRKALLACNFYNYETLHGILAGAKAESSPIILQLTEGSIDYLGLDLALSMARTGLAQFGVQGWIHLDHGGSLELAKACLDAGFDSVMIDASEQPMSTNIEMTNKVVQNAKRYGAHVEAELGYVAKLGQSHIGEGFTKPDEARRFVEETGVDSLAIAIGSAHGFYKAIPELDLDRLSEIRQITKAFLVLHGGSGIPDKTLQAAVERGICKINLATEIKHIFMSTLRDLLRNDDEIDLRKVFPPAIEAVSSLVQNKLRVINS